MNVEVNVHFALSKEEVVAMGVPKKDNFIKWTSSVLFKNGQDAEISIRIVNEKESIEFNKRYRHREEPTNVLSFSYDIPKDVMPSLLGDIVICAPLVCNEAKQQNKKVEAHWAHLVIHGILHLLNYDHQNSKESEEMENLEIKLLANLNYSNPYLI